MSGLALLLPEVGDTAVSSAASPVLEWLTYKGLQYAGKAIIDVLTGFALLILTPFHLLIGRAMYETKELAREIEHPFYPSEPDHYTDPGKSGFHKIIIAVNAIGDLIRLHFVDGASNWWMLSLPIIVSISILVALYIIMLFAPIIILFVNFWVVVFSVWVQAFVSVVNLIILPAMAEIAPTYNTILVFIWQFVLSLFSSLCGNAFGSTINPAQSCPALESVVSFIEKSAALFMNMVQTFYNAIVSAIQSIGATVCPGYVPNVSTGSCPSSICQAAGKGSTCGFSGTVIAAWIASEFQKVMVAILPVLDLLLAFSFDMASLLFDTLKTIITGGYAISDRTEAKVVVNQVESLFTGGLPAYFQSLENNDFVHDSQVEQTVVASAYQPFKNFLLLTESYAYNITVFLTSVLGDLLITLDTILCNVFHNPLHCLFGKFCYLVGVFLDDTTFNNLLCNLFGISPLSGNGLSCGCDQCQYDGVISGIFSFVGIFNYITTSNFETNWISGTSAAVPCIFLPTQAYCPNMKTACEKGLSILSDLSVF